MNTFAEIWVKCILLRDVPPQRNVITRQESNEASATEIFQGL